MFVYCIEIELFVFITKSVLKLRVQLGKTVHYLPILFIDQLSNRVKDLMVSYSMPSYIFYYCLFVSVNMCCSLLLKKVVHHPILAVQFQHVAWELHRTIQNVSLFPSLLFVHVALARFCCAC